MGRLIVTVLLLCFTSLARAEWVECGTRVLGKGYYDPTTIRRDGDIARVWIFTDSGA